MGPVAPSSSPLTVPPAPWWPALEGAAGDCADCSGGPISGEGWPQLETVDYLTKLIILGILLLALPWLLAKLVHSPREASRMAAEHAMGRK